MTITQHAHIYSVHTSSFNFGEIFFLIFFINTALISVVVVRLLIKAVEELTVIAELLDEVYLRVGLVNLLKAHDIGKVQLAHDVYFLAELQQPHLGVYEAEIKAFYHIFELRGFVRRETHKSGYAGS
jgi:hypothetical protein